MRESKPENRGRTSLIIKSYLLILLLLPTSINASELMSEIEKKSAALSSCTKEQPCEITIEKNGVFYVAKVKRSAIITEYGVLKYTTGSTTYYTFDDEGVFIKSKHTT